jgi:hypothetical protein
MGKNVTIMLAGQYAQTSAEIRQIQDKKLWGGEF